MPPEPNLSYTGLEEFTSEPAIETHNAKTSKDVSKVVKNDNGAPIIEDWKLDDEDKSVPQPKIEKKIVKPSPVVACTQTNGNAGTKDDNNAGQARKEKEPGKDYILLPLWTADPPFLQEPKISQDVGFKPSNNVRKKVNEGPRQENKCKDQEEKDNVNNTNRVNVVSLTVNAASNEIDAVGRKSSIELLDDLNMPKLEDISIFEDSNEDVFCVEGHTQEEDIDYDEVFAPVARTEAIRLFLAYASFKDFMAYQMDVKNVFLYGKIEKEVYVCQPLGCEDTNFPDKVYKVEKALYGLHQASRAWYESFSTYLLDNGFHKGKIDKTLYIRRHKDDILLVQVYADDIIFGSTKKELRNCKKQTVVENSTTKAEYVVASSCRGQVFWIQNQLLDYG
nr:retrovirus-related Pol polyprotein from transposon TNT 1-94 [Tanacetum cinerariifolium]